jgi:hypothetical protein
MTVGGGALEMHRLARAFAPSEGRTSEQATLRGEEQPLRTATGFVVGTAVCGLFWGAIAAIWYAL